MGDSSLSASELRQRYQRGGDYKDDELTASQLRARHGIKSNSASVYYSYFLPYCFLLFFFVLLSSFKDFGDVQSQKGSPMLLVAVIGLLVLAAIGAFFFLKK